MKYFLLLLLIQSSILINSTIAQTKITSIKARIISNRPSEDEKSDYPVSNQVGSFSNNIIDNPDALLFNVMSDQILVSVEFYDSENSGTKGMFRFSVLSDGKTTIKKEHKLFTFGNSNRRVYYYVLDDATCSYLTLKAELIKKNKVVSTMSKKIEFECGE